MGKRDRTEQRFLGWGLGGGTMRNRKKKTRSLWSSMNHKPMATRAGLKEQEQPKQNMASNIVGILTGKQTK